MPIYAYKCESCGYAKDVLQKMSDAPLTDCPQCGTSSFKKQLTAAGFQLKGSGWYVTDFRGGPNGAAAAKPTEDQASSQPAADSSPSAGATSAAPAAPAVAAVSSAPATDTGSGNASK